eukprot:jgi/Botrbrau1/2158/Bobra.0093s0059.1
MHQDTDTSEHPVSTGAARTRCSNVPISQEPEYAQRPPEAGHGGQEGRSHDCAHTASLVSSEARGRAAELPCMRPDDWAGPWIVGDSPRPRDILVTPRPACEQTAARQSSYHPDLSVAVPAVASGVQWAVPPETLAQLGADLAWKGRTSVQSLNVLPATRPIDRISAQTLASWLEEALRPYREACSRQPHAVQLDAPQQIEVATKPQERTGGAKRVPNQPLRTNLRPGVLDAAGPSLAGCASGDRVYGLGRASMYPQGLVPPGEPAGCSQTRKRAGARHSEEWIRQVAEDEEETAAVTQVLCASMASVLQQVAANCHDRGTLLATVWNLYVNLQDARMNKLNRHRSTVLKDFLESWTSRVPTEATVPSAVVEEVPVLKAKITLLQEFLAEQQRELSGRIHDLEQDLETASALTERVSKALAARLVAKDNALKALKADRNLLASSLHETTPVAQEGFAGLQELTSRLLVALNLPKNSSLERLAATKHAVSPVLTHLHKLTHVLQVMQARAATAEDEHGVLEARANVLEALADDENATPDALMASEVLARAKGAASIPAALLAKWRLEGGLDDLLELLSRSPAGNSPPPRYHPKLNIYHDQGPETAPVALHLEVVERVYLRIKIHPGTRSPGKDPSEDLNALQARIASLEAEVEKYRPQKELETSVEGEEAGPTDLASPSTQPGAGVRQHRAPSQLLLPPRGGKASKHQDSPRRGSMAVAPSQDIMKENQLSNRQRLSVLSTSGASGDGNLFGTFHASPWGGVSDVRLADAIARYGDVKPRSLQWLLKLMDAVYNSKGARIEDKEAFAGPKATFPEILLSHLSGCYGAKSIVSEYAACVMITTSTYEKQDERVQIFAKFLKEEWVGPALAAFLQASQLGDDRPTVACINYPADYLPRMGSAPWICFTKALAIADRILGSGRVGRPTPLPAPSLARGFPPNRWRSSVF